eukprot:4597865-Amphidinium_carterae.1
MWRQLEFGMRSERTPPSWWTRLVSDVGKRHPRLVGARSQNERRESELPACALEAPPCAFVCFFLLLPLPVRHNHMSGH